ncbi:type II toxin-antitoxin system RelE/ParE family toxin [Methylovirgula sp. 4M-Z18]|uniref:type II toxin-antitoxin system RelE/ParE family toxin n=1 Tax=Methylovirgula sp. 4M-Z18 TaxID=2293567 RepID=UPI000E2F52EA|nr:type II toxin-antitoxin system RelE/ParE family toxin [Methylovirgula sp. 4M-Z18]RFB77966.1 type II toxin-antitoxin system RelE/ParE family toxin [Methylovirgula sp. 4M-Z18]
MKALALSPAAQADLDHIWDHSAEHWGPDQADRYTDEIRDACQALASGVRRGRPVDVRPGYLKYATGAHMIYFRDHGDRVEIIRILHQRQDVSRNLPA